MAIGSILPKQEWSVDDFEKLQLSISIESAQPNPAAMSHEDALRKV